MHRPASPPGRVPFLAALLVVLLLAPRETHAQSVYNLHRSAAGVQANAAAHNQGAPSIATGTPWVVFSSPASNLVLPDGNGKRDVFAKNYITGAIVLISRGLGGAESNGDSDRAWISASGRFVAFSSSASNLVVGDGNGFTDVFRHDRDTDVNGRFDEAGKTATIRVSVVTGGGQANGTSFTRPQSISDDGDRIVFESSATNFVAGDLAFANVFVHQVSTNTTSALDVTPGGTLGDGISARPAISGNGQFAVFASISSDLVPAIPPPRRTRVYIRDLAAPLTQVASLDAAGALPAADCDNASVSDDGMVVTFDSPDAIAPGGGTYQQVYLRDRVAATTTLQSVDTGEIVGNGDSGGALVSGDGRYIGFESLASNLMVWDMNGVRDVFLRDRVAGITAPLDRSPQGWLANAASEDASPVEGGSVAAYLSLATNLGDPDNNGFLDVFLLQFPFMGPGADGSSPSDTSGAANDLYPVSFSVGGPVDPHTEGIRDARGAAPTPPSGPQPGDATAFGIRTGPVPRASGLATARPGDVFDYNGAAVPSEAIVFQSEPLTALDALGGAPAGTNNQIVSAFASGLVHGPGVAPASWASIVPARDNIDALSFGSDDFPDTLVLGFDPNSTLPDPPGAFPSFWDTRPAMPQFNERVVIDDFPGLSFRFSVDPWAIGLPNSAVRAQSGGADAGAGLGPWTSPGNAAGDVFRTPFLRRVNGKTVGSGPGLVAHDQPILALAPAAGGLSPMEDNLDALECVGDNVDWDTDASLLRGSVHARVAHVGPDLPTPPTSVHEPLEGRPVFFSVSRSSTGAFGSAVRSQVINDGGAAGDVFVMVKDPALPVGIGTNLLFIDDAELGLLSLDATPGFSGDGDYTDDLDALILRVCPEFRETVLYTIRSLLVGGFPPADGSGARIGPGFTLSITKYLVGVIPPGCIQVGFSVTTDAVGLEHSAVDWEAGPVDPIGGVSSAAGDIFYAEVTGAGLNPNYLWHEERDVGLDAGNWHNGSSTNLADLCDNIDGLDSQDADGSLVGVDPPASDGGPHFGLTVVGANPFTSTTTIRCAIAKPGRLRITVHDVRGALVAVIADEFHPAGEHAFQWNASGVGGTATPAGVYFVRAEFDRATVARKVVRVR